MLDLDANDSTNTGSDYATTFTEGGVAVTIADTDIAIGQRMSATFDELAEGVWLPRWSPA